MTDGAKGRMVSSEQQVGETVAERKHANRHTNNGHLSESSGVNIPIEIRSSTTFNKINNPIYIAIGRPDPRNRDEHRAEDQPRQGLASS